MAALPTRIPNQIAQDRDPRERLIVALDVSTAAAAQKIVAAVGDSAFTYKVGLQLYTAAGPQIVRDLVASGRRVFLESSAGQWMPGYCQFRARGLHGASEIGRSFRNCHSGRASHGKQSG